MGVSRRHLIGGLAATAVVATGVYVAAPYFAPSSGLRDMSPPDVLAAALAGEVLLIDIRRPDEWQRSGIPQGAIPIDMRRPDFLAAVTAARQSDTQPIAVICARGVRSQRLANQMSGAGLEPVIDVPEGMLGSFAGPGWLNRELPVTSWNG